ncbi:MAG: nucleotidyl transferase AbiEii/AbiGii toxin family protein [Clostridiales Family XIII bacterium]|jgi:hypothetical protein|nr:nucleotidyl transferase AbiEii/AbiGii toxin family protein [Clostridiales Family XIII bacterium]
MKIPNSRRNLDIAIDRVLGSSANTLQVRTVLANTIIGQLLPSGAVKGGSSLKLRYGDNATRFTRDLDTARSEDLSVFLEKLEGALKEGWNGFTGRIVPKDPATPKNVPDEYIMQPFEIKVTYNGKSWVTVPLEIGHDEIGDTTDPDYLISEDIVNLFEQLGFPAPKPIALLPIHHQIAQKLHAVSGEGSERAHDLIDLQVIEKNEKINYALTKEACLRLFESRKMQSWPPTIVKGTNWESLYDAQLLGLDALPNVDEAINWTNALIRTINVTVQP